MDASDYWRRWGDYYVSRELGLVMNAGGKILKPYIDAGGYERIGLYVERVQHNLCVHRVVAQAFVPNPHDLNLVDHQDGDILNNDASNLRWATDAQNQQNRRSQRGSSSRHKGVTWNVRHGKWRAAIRANGAKMYLGSFVDEDDAGRAYDTAARLLHGDFARLNLPRAD